MSYNDTLYWVHFTSPTTGHEITHAGMTWDSYHRLIGRLVVDGVVFTNERGRVTRFADSRYPEAVWVEDKRGDAGGR